ncbi:MAG: ArnT family glycosyltransferase [Ilumatobacteraceae bacterium]
MEATSTVPPRRALWACVVLAAVVRVTYWITKFGDPLLLNDSWYYSDQARRLTEGVWFREMFADQPGAEHGPLTSLLMWPFSYSDDYQTTQRLVTVITGILLVWVLGRFAEDLAGRTAGVAAALIGALYPNLWMNDGLVMSESISMLFVALTLWAAWRTVSTTDVNRFMRNSFLLGIVAGLAVLARSEVALLVPFLFAWLVIARRRAALPWRPALVAVTAVVLVVSPWVLFNLSRFDRPVLLTTNDGTTILGANCDLVYGGEALGGWDVGCVLKDEAYNPYEEPSVRSARQRQLGLQYMKDHITEVPLVVLARVGRTLDLYGFSSHLHQDTGEERPAGAVWAGIVCFWLLAVLSCFGARLLRRRDRWLLFLPMVVTLITTVLFYGAHRIRSSAEPSLVLFSAVAVAAWWERRRDRLDGPAHDDEEPAADGQLAVEAAG